MLLSVTGRVLLFALLWIVIVEAQAAYIAYGLLAAPLAAAASLAWLPPRPRTDDRTGVASGVRRALSVAGLLGWLAMQSLRGGIDVASRSLARPVRVDPVEVAVPVELTGGAKAVTLAVLGLLPGTIVAEVRDREALVHTLSPDLDVQATWADLQRRVKAVLR